MRDRTGLDAGPPTTGRRTDGLGDRAAVSVLWSVAQKWAVRLGGLVTVAILARHLAPEDFGVVAVAMAVIPIIYLLSDLGFSTYVVQSEDASPRVLSTAFWYSSGAGMLLAGGLVLTAPLIGAMLHLPEVVPVLYGLAPAVVFVALASVPTAVLRRRMAFRALAIQAFVAGGAGQIVAVVLAIVGAGVWALVIQLVVNQLFSFVLAWISSRWLPTIQFSPRHFVEMARFGIKVVGVDLIALGRTWAETAIIASTLGIAALGMLNIAQRLIQATQDLSAAAVVPVSTVVFAQIRSSRERLRVGYLRALEISYAVVMPIMVLVAVGAPALIPLLFGDQWGGSIVPAQALAVAGILTMGAMLDHGLFYGVGKPGRWFVYALAIETLTVITTALTTRWGLVGVAVGFVAVAMVATVVRWLLVSRVIESRPSTVALPFARVSVAAVGSAIAGTLVAVVSRDLPNLAALLLIGLTVVVIHGGIVRLISPAVFLETAGIVRRRIGRRPHPSPGGDGHGFPV
jgi:O-antigen/teichoic acid export membrane protein